VEYDVGVTFNSPHRGEIVQHIKLGERLTSFSGDSAQEWLTSIERRVRQLQGKTKRVSNEEITVTIPFNNGAELEAKFNEFFNPVEENLMGLPLQRNCLLSTLNSAESKQLVTFIAESVEL
jgi:hypothetical protein